MEHSPKYYIVEAAALPEIFQKVAEAKRMLHAGEVSTAGEAARQVGQRVRAGCRHQPQRVL